MNVKGAKQLTYVFLHVHCNWNIENNRREDIGLLHPHAKWFRMQMCFLSACVMNSNNKIIISFVRLHREQAIWLQSCMPSGEKTLYAIRDTNLFNILVRSTSAVAWTKQQRHKNVIIFTMYCSIFTREHHYTEFFALFHTLFIVFDVGPPKVYLFFLLNEKDEKKKT